MPVPFLSPSNIPNQYPLPQSENVLFTSSIELCGYKYYIFDGTASKAYQGETSFVDSPKRDFLLSLPQEQREEGDFIIWVFGMQSVNDVQMKKAVYFNTSVSDFLNRNCCQLQPIPDSWHEKNS